MQIAISFGDGVFRAADTTIRMRSRIASPSLAATALAAGLTLARI